jgi:hypothetical protein
MVDALTTDDRRVEVDAYRDQAARKTELERMEESKVKTGVFTGGYATNPVNGEEIPVWVADYVLRSYGTGGRRREFIGNCWDNFACIFYYPNDVVVSFNSRQAGFGYDDILCRIYGTEGTADTHYAGKVWMHARDFRSDGDSGNLYQDGAVANIATFHDNVVKGDFSNPTVEPGVRSNLTTILGRMAAYKNTVVTWSEMMKANERLVPDLNGLKT